MAPNQDFDITGNVKAIEKLKCELLGGVSELFSDLQSANSELAGRAEILSEIVISTYLLSQRLGIPSRTLDEKVINKLKLAALEDDSPLNADYKELYKYFRRG